MRRLLLQINGSKVARALAREAEAMACLSAMRDIREVCFSLPNDSCVSKFLEAAAQLDRVGLAKPRRLEIRRSCKWVQA